MRDLVDRRLLGLLVVALTVVACGSSGTSSATGAASPAATGAASNAPSATGTAAATAGSAATPVPTATALATPTPTAAAQQSIEALITAPHPKTPAAEVVAKMTAALAIDPTGGGFISTKAIIGDPVPGVRAVGKFQIGFVNWCQPPPTATMDGDFYREMACENIIGRLFKAYAKTGIPEFFEAALAMYNFSASVLPATNVAGMDKYLKELIL